MRNIGNDNYFTSGQNSKLSNLLVDVRGNNNYILIGNNVSIRANCHFSIKGNDCKIEIGDNTSMTSSVILEVNEDNQSIVIGSDCMFSNHVVIRTNDSHFIYEKGSDTRINPPKSVVIGNHVWIAAWVTVLKGVQIGKGCIIGLGSIVTRNIPDYSLAVGSPAKVVKSDVEWTRRPKI